MDTGACYGGKKYGEIVFRVGKMIKGDGLSISKNKMNALDPEHKEVYKFLGCEQGDKTNTKRVIENSKNELKKRTEQLAKWKLTNLIPT